MATLRAVRLRFPELFTEHQITPYGLAKRSKGRISLSTAYRLRRIRGKLHAFDAALCDAICDVLGIEPKDLFERGRGRKRHRPN